MSQVHQEPDHCLEYDSEQLLNLRRNVVAMSQTPATLSERERQSLSHMEGHVIICGSSAALYHFIATLRPKHLPNHLKIVIIDPDFSTYNWDTQIAFFNDVYYIRGQASKPQDLLRAGVMGASRAVILSPSATSESKDGKLDERGLDTSVVFIYQAISMANPSIHIVCEMVSPGSVPFLCVEKHAAKRTGDSDLDDLMFSTPFQQPYVTGNVGALLIKSLLFPRFWSAILAMSILLLVVVVVVVVVDVVFIVVVVVALVVVVVIGIVVAACVALFNRSSLCLPAHLSPIATSNTHFSSAPPCSQVYYFSKVMDLLACQAFFNRHLITILQELVVLNPETANVTDPSLRSSELFTKPIPQKYKGRTYGDLFRYLLCHASRALRVLPFEMFHHRKCYTLRPAPSILNPQPSTLNPQPSTLNPQPSTLPMLHHRKP